MPFQKPKDLLEITEASQLTEICTALFSHIWDLDKRQTTFKHFIQKVLEATQLTSPCVFMAFYYIRKLRSVYPKMQVSTGSEIRLFITALILANKYLEDSTFTNKTWSSVSGISVQELNIMEMEFLSELDFNLCISEKQFNKWVMQCQHLLVFVLNRSIKRMYPPSDTPVQAYKKMRSIDTICKPILSWSSSVSALASSRITSYTNYPV
ncbi:cyclin-domain-containing protein [Sporodiniella umbellata]|nr:cyclin-domain-containing protein [Sporodiniella umbellata]